jgi:hypothetical protein
VKRSAGQKSGVPVFFAFYPAARIYSPPVANDEHDALRHIARTLPMIRKIDKRFFR